VEFIVIIHQTKNAFSKFIILMIITFHISVASLQFDKMSHVQNGSSKQ